MWTNYKRLLNGIKVNTITSISYKSHYQALNIPKNATHKEIKDAYYRLSMIYHPDKNKGSEEAAKIFRDISEAYEVLGNVRQRRLYDSGANLNQKNAKHSTQQPFETMKTSSDMYKTDIRSREYNFNEWSKAHYTNVFQKQYTAREMLSKKKKNDDYAEQHNTYSAMAFLVFSTIFVLIYMMEYIKTAVHKHDEIKRFEKKKDSK
jgi:DnaJ family protein C protein 30